MSEMDAPMAYLAIGGVMVVIAVIAVVFILGSRSVADLRHRREDESRSENGQPHHR
jgi:hypothetical protein